ncbi:MAG: nicotinate-nucleotide--dimethylbenzimidazole phosphoribosyltransferase [Propionibacteriaceae bacterium]|jgi:nicotinate-nucleotide--dimethylbenzimidazole phosphoribosyltransferase|nr:nicotinate-nucleotide--dimethylbenzimidazole phosphoribosyltransferase [Propionibacteriaceae bacterium]
MGYTDVIATIAGADQAALAEAQARVDVLLKPPGSLGRLEEMAVRLAGMTGRVRNQFERRCVVVMAADNGVYAQGVASAPQEFTRLQAVNMTRGICGVSVLTAQASGDVVVVDIGIAQPTGWPQIVERTVRRSTRDLAVEPALTRAEAVAAIEVGLEVTNGLIDQGYQMIGTGEMGIANTTTTSACAVVLTGVEVERAVGRGAGLSDQALAHKIEVVRRALALHQPDPNDPLDVLSKVGGLDIAGLVGCYLAAASRRTPILVDGVISILAALLAQRLAPAAADFMIATHRSEEPAYAAISAELGLEPFLDLKMRLGEGTGCALAFPIVDAACAMMDRMGTFDDIQYDQSFLVDNREES